MLFPKQVDEETLVGAIVESGYPLQGIAAAVLQLGGFKVVEEWGHIDPDSNAPAVGTLQLKSICEDHRTATRVRLSVTEKIATRNNQISTTER